MRQKQAKQTTVYWFIQNMERSLLHQIQKWIRYELLPLELDQCAGSST